MQLHSACYRPPIRSLIHARSNRPETPSELSSTDPQVNLQTHLEKFSRRSQNRIQTL